MPTTRRKGASNAATPDRQRLNVRMSEDSYQRLMIHCVMTGKKPGSFLDDLVNEHCRDWRVQANAASRVNSSDRLDSTEHGSQIIPIAV